MPRSRASLAIALNATAGAAPEWIEVLPPGPDIQGRDGRQWRLTDPARVIARTLEDGLASLHVDYEHASELKAPQGEEAPAAGWIVALEERAGAIWAQVEWTPRAAAMIGDREYRYVSPTFYFDPETTEVVSLVSAALTNQPNLPLTALNRATDNDTEEHDTMDKEQLKALCKKLGLAAEASAEAILAAIDTLVDDKAKALNAAERPALDKFVPRADFDKLKGERDDAVKALNTIQAEAREAEITSAVDEAVKAGKVAPASKEFYLAVCRKDGGLDEFKRFVAAAPSITAPTDLDKRPLAGAAGGLTAEEKAVCRAMGIAEDAYEKARA